MSRRFQHLEFKEEDRSAQESVLPLGTPIRTAAQDLQMADDAYRLGRFEPALQLYTRALRESRALVPAWVGQVQMLVELGEHHEARLWSDKALELFRGNGDLLAAKSRACLRQGDARAALICSDASLQSPGSSPLRWQARGEVLLPQNPGRATDCFEKSLTEPAADWFDRIVIARLHLFHRRAAAAMEYAQAAVTLRPGHVYGWFVLGRCQEALGWAGPAQGSYARCLELSADFVEARASLHALEGRSGPGRFTRWLGGLLSR